jgi:hypothetical protein
MSHSYLTDLSLGIVPVRGRKAGLRKQERHVHDRPSLQRAVPLHRQLGALDHAEGSSTIWARGNLRLYGSDAEIALAFKNADRMLPQHVGPFPALPIHALDKLSLQAKLKAIGEIEGATKLKEPA